MHIQEQFQIIMQPIMQPSLSTDGPDITADRRPPMRQTATPRKQNLVNSVVPRLPTSIRTVPRSVTVTALRAGANEIHSTARRDKLP